MEAIIKKLEEIEALERAASKGEWSYDESDGIFCTEYCDPSTGMVHLNPIITVEELQGEQYVDVSDYDADFIVAAREAIPWLTSMLRQVIAGDEIRIISTKQHNILQAARETYGANSQISVAIGELNELAAALSKFSRYDTTQAACEALYPKVVEEVADVIVCLHHIAALFDIQPKHVKRDISQKLRRLDFWLKTGQSHEISTKVRSITEPPLLCHNCDLLVTPSDGETVCPACRQQLTPLINGVK